MATTRLIPAAFMLLAALGARADGRPETELALLAASRADVQQELLAADAARTHAMLAADVGTLERLLADDLSYGHTSGQIQSKKELIDEIGSGERKYRSVSGEQATARSYGCAGVVTGTAALDVEYRGKAASFTLRYTATYARDHDGWRLVAYQSVRLP